MASKLDNHITLADHGPIRVREKGFAVANVASLGRCAVENRGAQYRVEGGAGVADVTYECMKDSADAYAWEIVTGGGGAFVEKSGDTMTGDLTMQSGSADLNLDTYSTGGATQSVLSLRKSKDATVGTQTVVVATDQIGRISFYGSDGTNFEEAARIGALVDATPGNNDMPGRLVFYTTADGANSITERMRITSGGDVGIGKTPTTGVKLDVNGEIRGTSLVNATHDHTNAAGGGVLGPAALGIIGIYQDSDYTGSNNNSAQKVFNESTNGAATVAASTLYELNAALHIDTTGTTSRTFSFGFGGTATLTSIGYAASIGFNTSAHTSAGGTAQATGWYDTASLSQMVGASGANAGHYTLLIKGLVRVDAGGTFIPQYQWSVAPGAAGVTRANSFLTLTPLGASTVTTIGTWS